MVQVKDVRSNSIFVVVNMGFMIPFWYVCNIGVVNKLISILMAFSQKQ